jgi:hypothetical protein
MIVAALFTKTNGQPATGLTLTDIDLYLYARAKADGTMSTIWNGENPSEEVGGGLYSKAYDADTTTYDYFAYAHYTGATTLDVDYALMDHPFAVSGTAGSGSLTWTYTVTDEDTGVPIADVDVWVTTDEAGTNVIASGKTNQAGQVTFYLDAGTVYVWKQKSGYNPTTNPDTETVS